MDTAAIIFDRDGTLVEIDPRLIATVEAEVRAVAPTLPVAAALRHWQAWPGPWPRTVDDEPAFWVTFWDTLATQHGLPASTAAALYAFGDRYHTCFRAYPDTIACLTAIRARMPRPKLALLTNFELPSVAVPLQYAGIDPTWFDLLVSSSTIGIAKPAAAAYQAVCDQLALAPHACVFVDDLPSHIQGAAALGMRAILLDRANVHADWPGERVQTLAELVSRLQPSS